MSGLKILELDSATWYRGHGPNASALLRGDGERCCLGFLGQACGADDFRILNALMPCQRAEGIDWPEGLIDGRGSTQLAGQIANINDEKEIGDEERITKLQPLFARLGYRLVVKP
jgi:hypothetical protein